MRAIAVVAELSQDKRLLTHGQAASEVYEVVRALRKKICVRGDLPHVTVEQQLLLLEELETFPLGQFLIQNRGLDGYWTDYVITYPFRKRPAGLSLDGLPCSELEEFLLNRAPLVLASQERFRTFYKEIQKYCREGISIASVPCGLMSCILDLDLSDIEHLSLVGVDLDSQVLEKVYRQALALGVARSLTLIQGDAWDLQLPGPVDILSSNGLSFHEADDDRVIELYRQFFQALKPGGVLITSFLTPPPDASSCEWDRAEIDAEAWRLQRVIFGDILDVRWQVYRTSNRMLEILSRAGFTGYKVIIPDRARMFPTVVAHRP